MPTLKSKGRITIPKAYRLAHNWQPGQTFQVIDTAEGVLLKPMPTFQKTSLDQVASCLPFHGKAKTLAEMEEAIRRGAQIAIKMVSESSTSPPLFFKPLE